MLSRTQISTLLTLSFISCVGFYISIVKPITSKSKIAENAFLSQHESYEAAINAAKEYVNIAAAAYKGESIVFPKPIQTYSYLIYASKIQGAQNSIQEAEDVYHTAAATDSDYHFDHSQEVLKGGISITRSSNRSYKSRSSHALLSDCCRSSITVDNNAEVMGRPKRIDTIEYSDGRTSLLPAKLGEPLEYRQKSKVVIEPGRNQITSIESYFQACAPIKLIHGDELNRDSGQGFNYEKLLQLECAIAEHNKTVSEPKIEAIKVTRATLWLDPDYGLIVHADFLTKSGKTVLKKSSDFIRGT